ncbi:MAG: hypothetical protein VXZ53_08425, partial [Planctomycetota bacterium]|nr:hypothetical protein [Planctomycetota bacterium]
NIPSCVDFESRPAVGPHAGGILGAKSLRKRYHRGKNSGRCVWKATRSRSPLHVLFIPGYFSIWGI